MSATLRVLVGARPASESEIPSGARALIAATLPPLRVRATWALAEEVETGRMLRSCAVRVYDAAGRSAGFAVWMNGGFNCAVWRDPLTPNVGIAQMTALVSGTEWVAPAPRAAVPTGPCPRCGRSVRWKIAKGMPLPYAHRRDAGGVEGGQRLSAPCE